MGEDATDLGILADDLRCKIIYYSCITPNTISDLNAAWGYSSPTYLYQNNSLERLKDADLISVEKDGGSNLIQSNYPALFQDDVVADSRSQINTAIVREFLIHAKGFHPQAQHQDDQQDLLSAGRGNLEPELEDNLQEIEFSRSEYDTLAALWQTDVFKDVFLSLENLAKLFGEQKDELPDNPLNFLFKLTAGVTASMSRGRNHKDVDVPPGLRYRTENIIVSSHRALKQHAEIDSDAYRAFLSAMNDVYDLFQHKFREERFDYGFMEEFVNLTLQDKEDRKFNKLFEKYGGSDRRFF